nr:MAG TPA: hypothetical protein [Caudoviricetes sp.]
MLLYNQYNQSIQSFINHLIIINYYFIQFILY